MRHVAFIWGRRGHIDRMRDAASSRGGGGIRTHGWRQPRETFGTSTGRDGTKQKSLIEADAVVATEVVVGARATRTPQVFAGLCHAGEVIRIRCIVRSRRSWPRVGHSHATGVARPGDRARDRASRRGARAVARSRRDARAGRGCASGRRWRARAVRCRRTAIHDVHDNVWEWVADCGNSLQSGHRSMASRSTAADCRRRVRRGGSWVHSPPRMRSASRDVTTSQLRSLDTGFRVLLQLE